MAMFKFLQLQSQQLVSSTGGPTEASPQGVLPDGAQLLGRQGRRHWYGNKDASLDHANLCGDVVDMNKLRKLRWYIPNSIVRVLESNSHSFCLQHHPVILLKVTYDSRK